MPPTESERDSVELIATEFIEGCREGSAPPIEQYIKRYPHLADTITDLFPMIAALETVKKEDDLATARLATTRPLHLSELGDFRIVKEIGRGGMGVVYQAFQETLDRHVALKVLPKASLLDAELLKRFRQEARMAARLHHSNIVSLFGVGEHQGYHFLVMELVDGVSLDEVIYVLAGGADHPADPHSPAGAAQMWEQQRALKIAAHLNNAGKGRNWQAIAQLARDAAQSLQYAFEHGVLHRDIKPANLLLDVNGRVWISDFGLAQPLSHDRVQESQTGGTPRYLPPEAIEGERDHSSDIYSLGLTIYELLTLQPAFAESTPQQAAQRVANHQQKPVAPCTVDHNIPADLEAIVLKSIENSASDRYATAGHLAADLDRYIEGFPVRARPVGVITQGMRWCQRNRLVAGLLALVGSLLVMIAAISLAGFLNVLSTQEEVSNALQREKYARQRFESTLKVATHALDDIYTQFSPDGLQEEFSEEMLNPDAEASGERRVVLSGESAAVLESLLGFYDTLASQSGDSLEIRQAAARAMQRLGDVHLRLGQVEQAQRHFENALRAWRRISESTPENRAPRLAMAMVMNELGRLAVLAEDHESSLEYHQLAVKTLEPIEDHDADLVYQRARSLYFLGRPRKVRASLVAVEQLAVTRAERHREPPGGRHRFPRRPGFWGIPGFEFPGRSRPGPPDDTGNRASLERAVEWLRKFRTYSKQPRFQFLLACCYRDLEQVAERAPHEQFGDQSNDHDVMYREMAIILLTELVDDYPGQASYRYELAETLRRPPTTKHFGPQGNRDDIEALNVSLLHIDLLVERHPNQPRYLESRMHAHHRMGHTVAATVEEPELDRDARIVAFTAALSALENARKDVDRLVEGWPDVILWRLWSVVVNISAADLLIVAEDNAAALEKLESSVVAFEKICNDQVGRTRYSDELPALNRVLIRFLQKVDGEDLILRLKSATHADN